MAVAARDLPPAVRAEMTGRTEDQLLEQYTTILAGVLNKHYSSPPVTFYMDADELVELFGRKYAFMVATRLKFDLWDSGLWCRAIGPVEGEVDIHPRKLFGQVLAARSHIDPLGLLDAFHVGASPELRGGMIASA